MSVHQIKDGRWYVKFWESGRSHKKYFGRGNQARIEAKEYDLQIKKIKLRGGSVSQQPKKDEIHFDQLAQLYLSDRRNSGWPERSVVNFKNLMNRYVIPCIGHKICEFMTMADSVTLRAFIMKSSAKKNISAHTSNRYLAMTKAVFGWGFNNDLIAINPWLKLRMPRETPDPPDLLTVEEFKKVMECAEPHCRWAMDVEFNTGCRPGVTELFKLKFSDVDWDGGKILIRGTKTGSRVVDLKPEFLLRLKAKYQEAESEYIVDYKGSPLKQLRRSFKTALAKAGINKRVRLYDIRHMYGTLMVKNGGDIFAVKRLMGHSSITTTERYLHHAEELKKDAVNRLPDLGDI
jgi:integrase